MAQVVITGAGVASPIGTTLGEFAKGMFAGASGEIDIRGMLVASDFPVPVCAPVFPEGQLPVRFGEENSGSVRHHLRLLEIATEEAICHLPAGLPLSGVVYGGPSIENTCDSTAQSSQPPAASSRSSSLDVIQAILNRRSHGPLDDRDLITTNNLTVTSNQAIGLAFQRLRRGLWKRALVSVAYGGCGPRDLMNFHLLGALATDKRGMTGASKPFSADRSGFVLGEGAASLILEERVLAETRGAAILGAITGYAATSDAYRITDGRPAAHGAAVAMKRALRDAGLAGAQISAISAHGTSTRMGDRLETLAIKQAFGELAYEIPVISLKSQTGHCLAAAGGLEAVASLLMLAEQKLAPTINYQLADPHCDLDYVPNHSRAATVTRVLSNNFGFGGQNSCVVFEKADSSI